MRKLGVVVSLALMGLGFFVSAQAQTLRAFSLSAWNTKPYRIYHVADGYGNDNRNGRGRSSAWKTIERANLSAVAGNDSDAIVLVWPSGISDSLGGTSVYNTTNGFYPQSVTGTGRIFFYSAQWWYLNSSITGPNHVKVRGKVDCGDGPFNPGSRWTAAGFNFYDGCTIGFKLQAGCNVTCDSAEVDTVRESYIAGAADFRRGRRSAFQNCTGPIEFMGLPGDVNNITNYCSYLGCTFLDLRAEDWFGIYLRGHGPGEESWNNTISRCNLRVTNSLATGGSAPFKAVYQMGLTIEYSTIEINLTRSSGGDNSREPFLSYMRDNCDDAVLNADTLLFNCPNNQFTWMFTASGNDNTPQRRMVVDSCYFQAGRNVLMQFQDSFQGTTITNSTFVAYDKPALDVTAAACMYGTTRLEHNTFITAGDCPSLNFVGDPGDPDNPVCDSVIVTSCLFANLLPMTQRSSINDPASGWRIGWGIADTRTFIKSDWNFYYVNPYMFAHHDRDIMWTDTTFSYTVSKGGPTGSYATTFPPNEARSLYGWANFDAGGQDTVVQATPPCRLCTPPDSLFGANLGPASPGNGKGKGGTDPGAVQNPVATYAIASVSSGEWNFTRDTETSAVPETLRAIITNSGDATLTLSNLRTFTPWVTASLSGTTATYGQLRTLTAIVSNPGSSAKTDTVYVDTNDIARKTIKFPVRLNLSGGGGQGHLDP